MQFAFCLLLVLAASVKLEPSNADDPSLGCNLDAYLEPWADDEIESSPESADRACS